MDWLIDRSIDRLIDWLILLLIRKLYVHVSSTMQTQRICEDDVPSMVLRAWSAMSCEDSSWISKYLLSGARTSRAVDGWWLMALTNLPKPNPFTAAAIRISVFESARQDWEDHISGSWAKKRKTQSTTKHPAAQHGGDASQVWIQATICMLAACCGRPTSGLTRISHLGNDGSTDLEWVTLLKQQSKIVMSKALHFTIISPVFSSTSTHPGLVGPSLGILEPSHVTKCHKFIGACSTGLPVLIRWIWATFHQVPIKAAIVLKAFTCQLRQAETRIYIQESWAPSDGKHFGTAIGSILR